MSHNRIIPVKVPVDKTVNYYLLAYCKLLRIEVPDRSLNSEIQTQTVKAGEDEGNGGTTARESLKETLIFLVSLKYSPTVFNEMRICLKSVSFTGVKQQDTPSGHDSPPRSVLHFSGI